MNRESIEEQANGSKIIRFAIDSNLRIVCIIEAYISTPTLNTFVQNISSPYDSSNKHSTSTSSTAAASSSSTVIRRYRQFIGLVIERCGAVTLVEGLLPPVRCLLSTLPFRLRFLTPLIRNFTSTLAITIQANSLSISPASVSLQIPPNYPLSSTNNTSNEASSYSAYPSPTLTWFHTYIEELLQDIPTDLPLSWSEDANELISNWCRLFTQSCDPFVPGLEAIESPNGTIPHSNNLPNSTNTVTDNFRNYLLNIRDRAVSIQLDSIRWPFYPVIYWTPQCYIVNQSNDGNQCKGYAYSIRPKPYIIPIPSLVMNNSKLSTTVTSDSSTALLDPTIPEPVPEIDVYEVQGNMDGYLSFLKLPLPHVVMENDDQYKLSSNLPYSLTSLPGTELGKLAIDPRDLSIRRLLIDAGFLDPRAAHEISIRLACIMRQMYNKHEKIIVNETNPTDDENKNQPPLSTTTVKPNIAGYIQQDVPHTNPIAGFSPLKSPYRNKEGTTATIIKENETGNINTNLRISTIPTLHVDLSSSIDTHIQQQNTPYNTHIRTLHYTLIPSLHAQGALRRAGWIAAFMTKLGPTIVQQAYTNYQPIFQEIFQSTITSSSSIIDDQHTSYTDDESIHNHKYTNENSEPLSATTTTGVVPASPFEQSNLYYYNTQNNHSLNTVNNKCTNDQQFSYQALQLAVARSLRHSEFILKMTK